LNAPTSDVIVERIAVDRPTAIQVSGSSFLKAWQVDDTGGPVFVDQTTNANDATVNNWVLFPATENVDDYAAFGFADKFGKLTFNYATGTAGVGGTVAWEYWNGSAWTALSGVTDQTTGFTAGVADGRTVVWTVPSDWAKNTLNGTSAYYVRAKVTGTYSTNPIMTQGFVTGTLTVGQMYDYAIGYTLVSPTGEIAPTNWVMVTLEATKTSVQLAWPAVPNVLNYKVWGRQASGTLGLLATLDSTALSFTDTGAHTVVPPLIENDTVPIRYCELGTLNIQTKFSTRPKL
jgi:hypothetical protein